MHIFQNHPEFFCRGECALHSKKDRVSLPSIVTELEASEAGKKINFPSYLHFWVKKIALLGKKCVPLGVQRPPRETKVHKGRLVFAIDDGQNGLCKNIA